VVFGRKKASVTMLLVDDDRDGKDIGAGLEER
jgi:hypothetical protein